jgi:hypothetical protein
MTYAPWHQMVVSGSRHGYFVPGGEGDKPLVLAEQEAAWAPKPVLAAKNRTTISRPSSPYQSFLCALRKQKPVGSK